MSVQRCREIPKEFTPKRPQSSGQGADMQVLTSLLQNVELIVQGEAEIPLAAPQLRSIIKQFQNTYSRRRASVSVFGGARMSLFVDIGVTGISEYSEGRS